MIPLRFPDNAPAKIIGKMQLVIIILNTFLLAIISEITYNGLIKVKKFELYSYIRRYFLWRANAVSETARTVA